MSFVVRRARQNDAAALPAIERSAAELFRTDPPLAWLADTDVAGAAQHRQAIDNAHVWVAENTSAQLAGFIRALDSTICCTLKNCRSASRFRDKAWAVNCCWPRLNMPAVSKCAP
ncbi:hypothetical protein [Pseudomonas sp. RIT288]|jgi:hypothetical protein|uniref:hypothetical protein n=1 Tax=Pseudomonas sp. RIT288 TaxID=1470589 RepID=UPI0004523BE5|nr:hypothetical protein [Pseudomonas sp. RIT288]EZP25915.1 GCN5-like N-acetyltransferase [Pseudomonas sp. RIT288]